MAQAQWLGWYFYNDTATTEIYTLSLHDALPISRWPSGWCCSPTAASSQTAPPARSSAAAGTSPPRPRGSCPAQRSEGTRLNSSHANISYAVFCLKKKNHRIFDHITLSSV